MDSVSDTGNARTMVVLSPLSGMNIGGELITANLPIDYDQWEDGKPWHWKKNESSTD